MSRLIHEPLSAAGQARRDAMFGELVQTMHRVQRRRRSWRTARQMIGGGSLVLALVALATLVATPVQRLTTPTATVVATPAVDDAPRAQPARFVHVTSDATVLDRYTVKPATSRVELLGDDQLLATLRRLDRPTGLVRTGERTLLTASVVDTDGSDPDTPPSS